MPLKCQRVINHVLFWEYGVREDWILREIFDDWFPFALLINFTWVVDIDGVDILLNSESIVLPFQVTAV